jgi:hypothetical protein
VDASQSSIASLAEYSAGLLYAADVSESARVSAYGNLAQDAGRWQPRLQRARARWPPRRCCPGTGRAWRPAGVRAAADRVDRPAGRVRASPQGGFGGRHDRDGEPARRPGGPADRRAWTSGGSARCWADRDRRVLPRDAARAAARQGVRLRVRRDRRAARATGAAPHQAGRAARAAPTTGSRSARSARCRTAWATTWWACSTGGAGRRASSEQTTDGSSSTAAGPAPGRRADHRVGQHQRAVVVPPGGGVADRTGCRPASASAASSGGCPPAGAQQLPGQPLVPR